MDKNMLITMLDFQVVQSGFTKLDKLVAIVDSSSIDICFIEPFQLVVTFHSFNQLFEF